MSARDAHAVVAATLERYRWQIPSGMRGSAGDISGQKTGQSVDFHDFRAYRPGDDLRHVDWAYYARTQSLSVRLYREEVTPRLDIILDNSASMALSDGRKVDLARELALFIQRSGDLSRFSSAVHFGRHRFTTHDWLGTTAPAHEAGELHVPRLPSQGQRIIISDFMSDKSPSEIIQTLSHGAAALVVVMLLGPWENAPTPEGARRLQDCERGTRLLTRLSQATIAQYLERLQRLKADLRDACIATGAIFVEQVADCTLADSLRLTMARHGLVTQATN